MYWLLDYEDIYVRYCVTQISKERDAASPHWFRALVPRIVGVVGLSHRRLLEQWHTKVAGHSHAVIRYHEDSIQLFLFSGIHRDKMIRIALIFISCVSMKVAQAYNFPYESVQLTDADIENNSDLAFGELPVKDLKGCKTYPGYNGWPSAIQWSILNSSLDGALLDGIPPAAACYEGEYKDAVACNNARKRQNDALFA